ncbi:Transposase (class II) [Novosphingobium sp. Rr 2-17]|uniref:transposase n=1 Tax=Novosphingobium sp. Rr 2-17 TaxID=555793 RepID=UPI00026981A2|nr:transposase [Novosphingobium sp. Rr 2-17]EIZ80109.1 Transposase (class II) [Novosphingobium sp. Rr 2-17]
MRPCRRRDPLEKLGGLIDFEIFWPALDAALGRSDGSKGGRPPMDAVMMFKALILPMLYGLSDAQAGFQILDRRSFGRFLGLDDGGNMPDKTRSGASARFWCGPMPTTFGPDPYHHFAARTDANPAMCGQIERLSPPPSQASTCLQPRTRFFTSLGIPA